MRKGTQIALRRFEEGLRGMGFRVTKARRKVLEEVFSQRGHLQAEDLAESLRGKGVSRATVYRTLSLMEGMGLVRKVIYGERHRHFERVLPSHHDHLICARCGRVMEFEDKRIERLQRKVAGEHGFEMIAHVMEIHGICPRCKGEDL